MGRGRKKVVQPEICHYKAFTDFEGFPIELDTHYVETLNYFLEREKMKRIMDLSAKQKEFMMIWNQFVEKERANSQTPLIEACLNFNISLLVLRFLIQHNQTVKKSFRFEFLLHLTTLQNYKKITKSDIHYLMTALRMSNIEIQKLAKWMASEDKQQKHIQGMTEENPIEID